MEVIKNTYPIYDNVKRAKPGDKVHWEHQGSKGMALMDEDGECLFRTSAVAPNGNRYSTGTPPVLIGIIAQVKSKGWILEIK
jgi:hypothetical protein